MSSEDADTVLVNGSTASLPQIPSPKSPTAPPSLSRSSTFGVKKCWICIGESTEDDPDNPPVWRSPCKCNLTAHETCLLDWVADLENPKKDRVTSRIECPQCKSEIKIARPNSYIVKATRATNHALGQLVLPGVGGLVFGSIWAGAWIHGFQSVYLVFGEPDSRRIFEQAATHRGWLSAYALIPINLIFSRTNFADFVMPSGTLFLLATQLSEGFEIDMTIWPPRPSTVFACLPALRTAYNWSYHKLFCEYNRRWLEEVQPRQADRADGQEDNPADIANAQEAANDAGDGGLVLEVQVNLGGNVEPEPPADGQPAQGRGNAGNQNQNQNGHVHQLLGERGEDLLTPSLGQTVLGALMFPAVSAGMGGLLSYALPQSWMSDTNFMNGRPGLLRNRWGRSVVGGCLFVVLKDALVLYCRWKLAQGHRKRRIMDYDKQTKKYHL